MLERDNTVTEEIFVAELVYAVRRVPVHFPFRTSLTRLSLFTAGTYTIVVSAFQTKDEGEFDLSVGCNLPIAVTPIPQEGAGLFSRIVKGAWFVPSSCLRVVGDAEFVFPPGWSHCREGHKIY